MQAHTALVLGATGTAGSAIVRHLAQQGWRVIAVSRRPLTYDSPNIETVSADLFDKAALAAALHDHPVTHVFFAALSAAHRPSAPGGYRVARGMLRTIGSLVPLIDRVGPLGETVYAQIGRSSNTVDPQKHNLRLLQNVVEVTSEAPHQLRHVGLVTGAKTYGMHLSPHIFRGWQLPFHEESPRAPGGNFYYDQQDYLKNVVEKSGVTWSEVRPAFLIGSNPSAVFNLLIALGVYATLSKAQSMPLIFPADLAAASCLYEMSDSALVAQILEWSALTPAAHNQAFNAANGQPMRWSEVWDAIAAMFGLRGEIRPDGYSARKFIESSTDRWDQIVRDQRLLPHPLSDVLPSGFFDVAFVQDWDTVLSLDKLRRLGFTTEIDNVEMFARHFQQLRDQRIIPART